jgi:quercetin dioxygenase-like cupin family protein
MGTAPVPSVAPIALQPGDGEARWFLGFLITIKSSAATTNGRVAVIEHLGTQGLGSPLHVHHNEDEWFYVTEGELTFRIGRETIVAPAGSFVYGPRDIPHAFSVTSARARFLLVTEPAGLENFLRALSEPAAALTMPPPSIQPPDFGALAALAAEFRDRDPRTFRYPLLIPATLGAPSLGASRPGSPRRRHSKLG